MLEIRWVALWLCRAFLGGGGLGQPGWVGPVPFFLRWFPNRKTLPGNQINRNRKKNRQKSLAPVTQPHVALLLPSPDETGHRSTGRWGTWGTPAGTTLPRGFGPGRPVRGAIKKNLCLPQKKSVLLLETNFNPYGGDGDHVKLINNNTHHKHNQSQITGFVMISD